jgi:type III restriction enzyme
MLAGHHHFEGEGFAKPVMSVRPYTEIRSLSLSKNQGDRVYDYMEHIEPVSTIRQKVFTGFVKAYHKEYKFDSKTEKDFAYILEHDALCIKWLKPALTQFNIYYGRPSKNYTPDFIVETPAFIAMVETKKRDAMEEADVQAKTKAALHYCYHATEYNRQISGKPWRYVLIPHDQVRVNMSLEFLLREWGVEG